MIPVEKKLRIVLSVLQGEVTVAEAARREKFSEQAIGNWKRQFLEGGKAGIEAGKSKPSTREQQLEDEVAELTALTEIPQLCSADSSGRRYTDLFCMLAKRSCGVFQPRVLRGRRLSSSLTRRRCPAV